MKRFTNLKFQNWNWGTYLAIVALVFSAAASAEEGNWPWPSERFNPQQRQNIAGQFDYYALVLSWSPSYCSEAGDDDDQQCNRSDGRRYSFVLHGLWPQYEKDYPSDCRLQRRPYVAPATIDRMLDIMPSTGLIIHEYKKHGTCSGLQPDPYFSVARELFTRIRVPDKFRNPFEAQFMSPDDVVKLFTRVNPGIPAESMAVACGGAGNRLKEIHFCFTKDGQPRACGGNENPRRMCTASSMFVPPVRSTAHDDQFGGKAQSPSSNEYRAPIPRPRLIEGPNGSK